MTPSATFPSTSIPNEQRWTPRLWGVLAILCLVMFLDGLDVSMVGVALPSIGAELGLSTASLQWIVNGYVLGFGGLLLLGGRTADLLGRRRVFLIALAVFGVASLVGGLVDDGGLLIATRFVKGAAAAFTAPTAMSILTTTFPEGHARNKALSIFAVFGASGYSSGLILGGLLTSAGWRWNFLMPVPLAAIALVGGYLLIHRDRPAATGGYDLAGAATLTSGMLLAVYTVVSAPERGWTHPLTLGAFVLAAVLLAVFVRVEQRVAHPLVRLGILRIGSIVRANLGIVAMFGSYLSFQFMLTIYFQSVLGWSPLRMAFALLPAGLMVAFGSPAMGRVIDRFGTQRPIVVAMAAFSLGYVLFLRAGGDADYVTDILPSVLLIGVGFTLAFSSIMSQATSGVDDSEQGLASGLVQTSGQVGAAVVLAVTTALVTAGSHSGEAAGSMQFDQFRPGLVLVTGLAVAGVLVMLVPMLRQRPRRGPGQLPGPDEDERLDEPVSV
ncbi:putative MFS family arabinose efflux permease [Haloactinopolyspora alba]|uniref:Putative MFS family arabinose efflux permease n=1 Tax=Haloactinopolyspora alba TaxID=648780 RepID=A0A2P8E766_9ACTN|nr:MFS transporter [Haloactinopolyspora alba]PSL05309.1 putative MFS family arabinose efflux permease [Haloactinopolyspora alba]